VTCCSCSSTNCTSCRTSDPNYRLLNDISSLRDHRQPINSASRRSTRPRPFSIPRHPHLAVLSPLLPLPPPSHSIPELAGRNHTPAILPINMIRAISCAHFRNQRVLGDAKARSCLLLQSRARQVLGSAWHHALTDRVASTRTRTSRHCRQKKNGSVVPRTRRMMG